MRTATLTFALTGSTNQVFVDLQVGVTYKNVRFKLDTDACCNILFESDFKCLKVNTPLQKPKAKLTAYNGPEIQVLGVVSLPCMYKSQSHDTEFYVVRPTVMSQL